MAEGIKVFFSYSHRDEQLRDELAKHLSAMRRQDVIAEWHDRKITAGDEWAGEIDENLDSADIILLLISADFLASDYCYDVELKQAMERHDAGDARVIPVILRPVDWRGEAFGKLQALPRDAKAITLWPDRDEAFVDVARGLRVAVEERKVQQATPARSSHKTHIVDQMHRGDFVTISEAIAAANPGDKILVRPGLYNEGLVIDKPLEITGDGDRADIIVQAKGQNTVLFRTAKGLISNLTLRQMRSGDWFGVYIAQGQLELEDCDILSQSLDGIAIHNSADPRLRRNYIHDNRLGGVYIFDYGQGLLEDNAIFRNGFAGVHTATGGHPFLRKNKVYQNKEGGLLVTNNGKCDLEDNDIFDNGMTGVMVKLDGNVAARYNRIINNKYSGVWVDENGGGIFENNDLRGNGSAVRFIHKRSIYNIKWSNNIEE